MAQVVKAMADKEYGIDRVLTRDELSLLKK
jgi:hypothetical protein